MDKKRLVLIIIFLVVCLALGTLLYFIFFKKSVTAPPRGTTPITSPGQKGQLPTSGDREISSRPPGSTSLPSTNRPSEREQAILNRQLQVQQVVTENILEPSVDANGSVRFYNKQDGHFYKINSNGEMELLSNEVFYNVQDVTWSPKDTKSIIEYPDGSNIFYDFNEKKQVSLPKHWEQFSFDKDGSAIAAKSLGYSPENRWLITANPDGNNLKLIEPMGENANKVDVSWSPNQQILATSRTGEAMDQDRQEILFVGQNKENFKSMVVEGRGFKSSWSPSGDKLIYSVYSSQSDFKPQLWVVDAEPSSIGNERKLLNVNTWPEKCSFANPQYIYCGVPEEMETGAGIAPSVSDNTPDQIYRIDVKTGNKEVVPMQSDGYVVEKMFLGDDGKTMYFTDKRKPGLFKVPL